jgi:hypothetical protein
MSIRPDVSIGRYQPRAAWFERLVECEPAQIKLSAISFPGTGPDEAGFARATALEHDPEKLQTFRTRSCGKTRS